jgi:hypothetical protein
LKLIKDNAENATFSPGASGLSSTILEDAIIENAGDFAAHVIDATDAHDASAISVLDSAERYTATEVESALAEIAGTGRTTETVKANDTAIDLLNAVVTEEGSVLKSIKDNAENATFTAGATGLTPTVTGAILDVNTKTVDHIADATAAHAGTAISNTPAGGIEAVTVQAAIDELESEKAPTASPSFTGTVTTAGAIELGHASDTTLARTGAGVIAVEGVEITTNTKEQTLTNKTLTSPKINEDVVLTPTATELNYVDGVTSAIQTQINAKSPTASPTFTGTVTLPKTTKIKDTTGDHTYDLAVSELTADRTVTMPLLTGNDEFTFNAHEQTLTNKTLTSPKLNEAVALTATATQLNAVTADIATNVSNISENTQLIATKDQANLNAHNSITKRLAIAEAETYNGTDIENTEPTNEVGIATDGDRHLRKR